MYIERKKFRALWRFIYTERRCMIQWSNIPLSLSIFNYKINHMAIYIYIYIEKYLQMPISFLDLCVSSTTTTTGTGTRTKKERKGGEGGGVDSIMWMHFS